MAIQRYTHLSHRVEADRIIDEGIPADDGLFVTYVDHSTEVEKLTKALQLVAFLWPDPGMCAEFVPEWVGPNDGRMRAEALWYAVTYARKALGMPTHPEPEYWHKKKTEREDEG
jgi:hypothetical protein